MTGVVGYALDAQVFFIVFAKKPIRLIVMWAELMIFAHFLFLAGKLKCNVVFCQYVGLYLWVMLKSAGRAI